MSELIDKKLVKDRTNSSRMLVFAGLAVSLSGSVSCYGFDENSKQKFYENYNNLHAINNQPFEESLKRITDHTKQNYKGTNNAPINDTKYSDLKFVELSNKLAENQIDLDNQIQFALNQFGKILGAKNPKKNRL